MEENGVSWSLQRYPGRRLVRSTIMPTRPRPASSISHALGSGTGAALNAPA